MKNCNRSSRALKGVFALAALALCSQAQAQTDLKIFWKDSLRIEDADKQIQLRIGGRVQNDWGWFDQDSSVSRNSVAGSSLDQADATEIRRARLYLSGLLDQSVEFKFQFDFAGGDADFKDAFVGLVDVGGIGGLRIGQFKEPFSLDWMTSSNHITFMERSVMNSLVPGRGTGAMLHNTALEGQATWAVGVFRDTDDYGNGAGNGEYAYTGRVTYVPMQDEDSVIHLGLGASIRETMNGRFRGRPETHFTSRYVDTGAIAGNDSVNMVNAEAAGVWGPFSLQGEYTIAMAEATAGSDPDFDAHYVQASYMLTGEKRPYDASKGIFRFVKPTSPYGEDGCGAWEAAVRYSSINLDDGMVNGGELSNITLGLNWYLNNNARVMFNYVMSDLDGTNDGTYVVPNVAPVNFDGDTQLFMVRFQLQF